jgi:hypothetical protein
MRFLCAFSMSLKNQQWKTHMKDERRKNPHQTQVPFDSYGSYIDLATLDLGAAGSLRLAKVCQLHEGDTLYG